MRIPKQVVAALALASVIVTVHAADRPIRQDQDKPDIIYILADDAGMGDIGCYGGKKTRTPNIAALCKEAMKFTQHYGGSIVCAPSRIGDTQCRTPVSPA